MNIKTRAITEFEINGKEVRFEFAMPFTWEEVTQAAQFLHSHAAQQIEALKAQQKPPEEEAKVEDVA